MLVTAHDAFGYFGRAYDIEVVGLQGISTVAEFGLADVRRIVDLIVTRKVKAVFVESSVPRRSIDAVVAGMPGPRARRGDRRARSTPTRWAPRARPRAPTTGMVRANVQDHRGGPAMSGPTVVDRRDAAPLEVHDLTVAYHRRPVLWDIDFALPPACSSASSGRTAPARAR